MMTTLLLTGATGLVGSRLLPRLIEDGFACRALVRADAELPPGATAVRGDLADPDSLRTAVDGVDAVVHLAAVFRTQDEDAIWRANRDGTRHQAGEWTVTGPVADYGWLLLVVLLLWAVFWGPIGEMFDGDGEGPNVNVDTPNVNTNTGDGN